MVREQPGPHRRGRPRRLWRQNAFRRHRRAQQGRLPDAWQGGEKEETLLKTDPRRYHERPREHTVLGEPRDRRMDCVYSHLQAEISERHQVRGRNPTNPRHPHLSSTFASGMILRNAALCRQHIHSLQLINQKRKQNTLSTYYVPGSVLATEAKTDTNPHPREADILVGGDWQ